MKELKVSPCNVLIRPYHSTFYFLVLPLYQTNLVVGYLKSQPPITVVPFILYLLYHI